MRARYSTYLSNVLTHGNISQWRKYTCMCSQISKLSNSRLRCDENSVHFSIPLCHSWVLYTKWCLQTLCNIDTHRTISTCYAQYHYTNQLNLALSSFWTVFTLVQLYAKPKSHHAANFIVTDGAGVFITTIRCHSDGNVGIITIIVFQFPFRSVPTLVRWC